MHRHLLGSCTLAKLFCVKLLATMTRLYLPWQSFGFTYLGFVLQLGKTQISMVHRHLLGSCTLAKLFCVKLLAAMTRLYLLWRSFGFTYLGFVLQLGKTQISMVHRHLYGSCTLAKLICVKLLAAMTRLYLPWQPWGMQHNQRHLSNIDCLTACTTCLVCFISTVNSHSKKRRLLRLVLVAGT